MPLAAICCHAHRRLLASGSGESLECLSMRADDLPAHVADTATRADVECDQMRQVMNGVLHGCVVHAWHHLHQ